jgi:hypothetical protein
MPADPTMVTSANCSIKPRSAESSSARPYNGRNSALADVRDGLGGRSLRKRLQRIDSHWQRDILDSLQPAVLEVAVELSGDFAVHLAEMQMPPGSTSAWSRAATLTPSP